MNSINRKIHWEDIYNTKPLDELSWYQPGAETSIQLISELSLPKDAAIIDIGAGDSFLAERLLKIGYTNISVLDISEAAITRARSRLGVSAKKIKWLVCDVIDFQPQQHYDLWHDRAAFHFLTRLPEIDQYLETAYKALDTEGKLILGTFSNEGPSKCSGIEITQYSEAEMIQKLAPRFTCKSSFTIDHRTPFDTVQNFTFGSFAKK